MKRIVGWGIGLMVVGLIYSYYFIIPCTMIDVMDFNKRGNHLYLDATLSQKEGDAVLQHIAQARQRIKDMGGKAEAEPVIIITQTKLHSRLFGVLGASGKAYALPWKHYIVINAHSANVDVLAHELMHIEVEQILGFYKRFFKMPVWLDEGIAMQVDYRSKYDLQSHPYTTQELLVIQTRNKRSEFWTNSRKQNQHNYLLAKAVVYKILQQNPSKNIFERLKEIQEGKAPHEAFKLQ
jgi:hypothetical protein